MDNRGVLHKTKVYIVREFSQVRSVLVGTVVVPEVVTADPDKGDVGVGLDGRGQLLLDHLLRVPA